MNIFEATRSAILGKQKMIRVSKNGERFLIDPANDMDQCRIEVENEQRAVEKNWVPSQEELLAQDWTVTAVLPKESLSESLWWMTEAFEEHYSQKFPEFVGIVRKMTEKLRYVLHVQPYNGAGGVGMLEEWFKKFQE